MLSLSTVSGVEPAHARSSCRICTLGTLWKREHLMQEKNIFFFGGMVDCIGMAPHWKLTIFCAGRTSLSVTLIAVAQVGVSPRVPTAYIAVNRTEDQPLRQAGH